MPIEQVSRTILIDDLAVAVSAWRWICDACGHRQSFHDNPMPDGISEMAAQHRGWRIDWSTGDGEACKCPACAARALPHPNSEAETKR